MSYEHDTNGDELDGDDELDGELDGDELDGDDLDGQEDGESVGGGDAGTILRPMLSRNMVHPSWERDPKKKLRQTWDPTVRWGDKVIVRLPRTALPIPINTQPVPTADLVNVPLSKPAVCQIHFHAEVITPNENSAVVWTRVEVFIGNGSQMTRMVRQFNNLPANQNGNPGVPIDAQWTIPLANIRARVTLFGANADVLCSLSLVPLVQLQENK